MGAVEHWNKALQQFVEEMAPGSGDSCLDMESRRILERSLYLNLAQGYLKLCEPERALRACLVVLQEDALNDKALFRAADACLALKSHEKAADWLGKLLEAQPSHLEAKKLLQRVEAERREESRKQKAAARRMLGACEGLSEARKSEAKPALPEDVAHTLSRMEPESLCKSVDIAQAAAHAARQRETALQAKATEKLPEPAVVDLDAFRAKVNAKTQRFHKYMDRSRKQRANAGHGLKLAWLRTGQDVQDLSSFQKTLREEAGAIEAADLAAAQAEAEEECPQEDPAEGEDILATQPQQDTEACIMEEMD